MLGFQTCSKSTQVTVLALIILTLKHYNFFGAKYIQMKVLATNGRKLASGYWSKKIRQQKWYLINIIYFKRHSKSNPPPPHQKKISLFIFANELN